MKYSKLQRVTALQLKKWIPTSFIQFYCASGCIWGSLYNLNGTWLSSGKNVNKAIIHVLHKIRQESESSKKAQYIKLLLEGLIFLELTNTYHFKSAFWTKASKCFLFNFLIPVIPQPHTYTLFKSDSVIKLEFSSASLRQTTYWIRPVSEFSISSELFLLYLT